MKLLALDAATTACSVACWSKDAVTAQREEIAGRRQAEILMPMVKSTMQEAGFDYPMLDAIAVTNGPGSFTGVRIGLATARGLALAAGLPLTGVTTLQALAAAPSEDERRGRIILATLDARRDQLYGQFFDENGDPAGDPFAAAAESIPGRLERIFGDGTPLCWLAAVPSWRPVRSTNRGGATDVPRAHPSRTQRRSPPWWRGVASTGRRASRWHRFTCATRASVRRRQTGNWLMDSLSPDALPIEKMKSYDLPAIASLHAVCFEDPWHTELLGRILSAPGTFGLFSRPRGKVVGFVLCRSSGQEGEILSLAVAPGLRRNGLGGALLEAAMAQALKQDIEALFLEVAEDNEAARRLYQKFSFATVGRRPNYYRRRYGPSVDALTLRRTLTSNGSCEN